MKFIWMQLFYYINFFKKNKFIFLIVLNLILDV